MRSKYSHLKIWHITNTVVPRDTSPSLYDIFKIRAVDRTIFCFKIREAFEIRATGSAGYRAALPKTDDRGATEITVAAAYRGSARNWLREGARGGGFFYKHVKAILEM